MHYTGPAISDDERIAVAKAVFEEMDTRRSVRHFTDRPVPREMIDYAIAAASTAPSGAHMQPWTFVVVSDPDVKQGIRLAAEEEERTNYEGGRLPAPLERGPGAVGDGLRQTIP